MCECGDNSCSPSSPACCKTETCQWSWTGGGGGDGSGKPVDPLLESVPLELNKEADVCNSTPLILVDASSYPENRPHYPPSMEFTVVAGKRCKYTGDSNGAGILKCDGSKHSPCKARGLDDKKRV
ncbi:hypothetical protein BDFG_09205 [Blastomyces dermatitidis ATCC 26199]|nr:hypothetical protein BDFG_09205 [Blastomyces dermatitidis ATCC 26199]